MLLVGSHSDTQPLGGWLDGAFGVACGLELARAAVEADGPRVAAVSFQDEEGRFGSLTGSAVWSGRVPLAEADRGADHGGVTFGEARGRAAEIAPLGEAPPSLFRAYLEPHIEQGPVLDAAGLSVGVVEAIVGLRQLDLRFEGAANHAGTTPMAMRRDAVRGLGAFMRRLDEAFAPVVTERTVWTLGRIVVEPNTSSIVPGAAIVSVQIRDAETDRLDHLAALAEEAAGSVAAELGLGLRRLAGRALDPVWMDPGWAEALARAAEAVAGGRWRRMPSGALHDASNVAAVLPSAMLFVPSLGGISHNPGEDTRAEDLRLGLEVLARAVAAGVPPEVSDQAQDAR